MPRALPHLSSEEIVTLIREARVLEDSARKRLGVSTDGMDEDKARKLLRDAASAAARRDPDPDLRSTADLLDADALYWCVANSWVGGCMGTARRIAKGIDDEELVQSVRIGLYRAALRWDPDRGVPFPAFGKLYVRLEVQRVLVPAYRPVRVPETYMGMALAWRRRVEAGEDPEAAASAVGKYVTTETLRRALTANQPAATLNGPLAPGSEMCLTDVLFAESPSPEEDLHDAERRVRLREAVEALPPSERNTIVAVLGLDGPAQTVKQIAAETGMKLSTVKMRLRRAVNRIGIELRWQEAG